MIYEIENKANDRHGTDEGEEQSRAFLMVRQRIQACVKH